METQPSQDPQEKAKAILRTPAKLSLSDALVEAVTLMGRFPGLILTALFFLLVLWVPFQVLSWIGGMLSQGSGDLEMLRALFSGDFERVRELSGNQEQLGAQQVLGFMLAMVGGLIAGVFYGPILGGFYLFAVRLLRNEKDVAPSLVFAGFGKPLLQLLLTSVLRGVIILVLGLVWIILVTLSVIVCALIGAVLGDEAGAFIMVILGGGAVGVIVFIIAGLVFLLFSYAIPLVIDQGLDFWTALEVSLRGVYRRWFEIFLWAVLATLLSLLGMFFVQAAQLLVELEWSIAWVLPTLLIGAVTASLATALVLLMDASVYDQLFCRHLRTSSTSPAGPILPSSQPESSPPHSSPPQLPRDDSTPG